MNLEEAKISLKSIRNHIEELKEIEDIILLVKFFNYSKSLLTCYSVSEIKIRCDEGKRDLYDRIVVDIPCDPRGNEGEISSRLFNKLWSKVEDVRTIEYKKEFEIAINIIDKETSKIVINHQTTTEDFLNQINRDYAIKFSHYIIEKSMNENEKTSKSKIKI